MTDVLKLLPPLMWRGRQYPNTARRVFFRHEGVDHVVQYRDFEFVEQLGAHGLMFAYTIPAREEVARGPYAHLFEGLPVLFRDMLNREADNLTDPVYGDQRCVPVSYEETTDPGRRDGADVQVEFKFSPLLTDEDANAKDLSGVAGLTNAAGRLDEEVAKASWGQEPSPEPSVDLIQGVDGLINQGVAQIGKAKAALDDYAFRMKKLEETCERLKDPANYGIRDQARTNRSKAIQQKQRLSEDPATRLRTVVVRATMTLGELARDVNMTLDDLLGLNPELARLPYVNAGTVIIVRGVAQAA